MARVALIGLLVACFAMGAVARQVGEGAGIHSEYDTSKIVTLKGRVNGLDALGTEASLLLLNGAGASDSWAIEGDPRPSLEQSGWYDPNTRERTVKANTEATVSVYLPLPNSAAQTRLIQLIETTLSLPIARKVFGNFVRLGQFAYGLDVTLADGRTLRLGTRRQRK
jgi:hypothetical protein